MHPQLAQVTRELELAQSRLDRLAEATPDERWTARSPAGGWSVGECVAHLNLTSEKFIPLLRAALADEALRGVAAPSRYPMGLSGRLVSLVAGPMVKVGGRRIGRVRTLSSFVPSGDAPRRVTVARFEELQWELLAITRDAEGRPLERMRIRSPFDPSGRLRYNAYAALVVLPRHQQRHLDQADEVWATTT